MSRAMSRVRGILVDNKPLKNESLATTVTENNTPPTLRVVIAAAPINFLLRHQEPPIDLASQLILYLQGGK